MTTPNFNKLAQPLLFAALLLASVATSVDGQSALDGFDPNANGTVRAFVVQPDGKIPIGEGFTARSPNGGPTVLRNRIAGLRALSQQFSFNTVALSGQPAPGTGAGVNFESFAFGGGPSPVTLNAAGQAAFFAQLTGPGVTFSNDGGFWSDAPGSLALLAREGDSAPSTAAGVNYSMVGVSGGAAPSLNGMGQSAFVAFLNGPGVTGANNSGVWFGAPGSVALLAREGDPAPGLGAGINYGSINPINAAVNAEGQCAFFVTLIGAGVTTANDGSLWSGSLGTVALLAREGDPAPGVAGGVNYGNFNIPALNAAGQSAFFSLLTGTGVTTANDSALWSGIPGSVALLARKGDPAPGTTAGVDYMSFGSPFAINAAGRSVFAASLGGPGVTSDNDRGLWSGIPGSVVLLTRGGDPAPGTAPGVNYLTFSTPALNAEGRSAFSASITGAGITGANDSGLWFGPPGSLAKVFCEGEAAPGAGSDVLFGDAINSRFALNDRGGVVFLNSLAGPDVTADNDGSLWFSDGAGNLSLIVREGDSFEVSPGDTRIISLLTFEAGSGDEDGFPCGLNDPGQVALYARFTDGSSGIFIATPGLQLTAAVSRKIHGGFGPFDINLPLTGESGVECRSSDGSHTLFFSFTNDVISGNASVTGGMGTTGIPTFSGNTMTVDLTGVTDVQKITVTLSGVTDSFAQILPTTAVSVNMLAGDINANKSVNTSDIGQVKSLSGAPVNGTNFRADVAVNGSIGASDISLVKFRSGQFVP